MAADAVAVDEEAVQLVVGAKANACPTAAAAPAAAAVSLYFDELAAASFVLLEDKADLLR